MTVVAFEADLYDGAQTRVLRLCSAGPLAASTPEGRVPYEPVLIPPIVLGASISASQPGQVARGTPNGGVVAFALHDDIRPSLAAYSHAGRTFRVFEGPDGASDIAQCALVYVGRLVGLTKDEVKGTAQYQTTDAGVDLDRPLVERVYGEVISSETEGFEGVTESASGNDVVFSGGDLVTQGVLPGDVHIWTVGLAAESLNTPLSVTAVAPDKLTYGESVSGASAQWSFHRDDPDGVAGRPRLMIWGQVFEAEPVLVNNETQTYEATYRRPLQSVDDLTVGGIPWDEDAPVPGGGKWAHNANRGEVYLGSPTLGGDLRIEAKGYAWETCTTGELLREWVASASGGMDAAALADLRNVAPALIGYMAKDPINMADAADEIMTAILGWRYVTAMGLIAAGLIAAPGSNPVVIYSEVEITSLELVEVVDPLWRVRTEYRRNQSPGTQFYPSVTEEEAAALRQTGIIATPWENGSIKSQYPRAVDLLIRSLVVTPEDALLIRDRAVAAYGVERRIYNVGVELDPLVAPPPLYSTVGINRGSVVGNFRLTSALRSIGGGVSQLQIWG